MAIIKLRVWATSEDIVTGEVPNDLLEQYYNGEIDDWELYQAMKDDDYYNIAYEVTHAEFDREG